MAEYIEREAAFDAVFGQFCASSDETEAALNAAIEEIRAIPAADVRSAARGAWREIGKTGRIFVCSACDKTFPYKTGFCPNCGAMMEES